MISYLMWLLLGLALLPEHWRISYFVTATLAFAILALIQWLAVRSSHGIGPAS